MPMYLGSQRVCPVVRVGINNQNKAINENGTYTADSGYTGLGTVTVNVPTSEPEITTLTVTPTTTAQTITAPSGTDGYNPVNVSAVTANIDNNIKAENIKSGITILGVNGSVTELAGETRTVSITSTNGNTFTPSSGKNGITSIKVTPTNQARTVTPTTTQQTLSVNSGYSGNGTITIKAVTSAIDSDIQAGNIKKNVTILGVTGTLETGITPTGTLSITENGTYNVTNYANAEVNVSKYGATIDDILGDVTTAGTLQHPTTNCNLVFTGVKTIVAYGLSYKFYYNTAIKSVSFPNLTTLNKTRSLSYAFSNATNLTSVSFPKLATISGNAVMAAAFLDTSLTSLSFPALTSVGSSYTSQFNNMLYGVENCTVHFPTAMQGIIGAWDSVTSGFGGTNTTVLFDL